MTARLLPLLLMPAMALAQDQQAPSMEASNGRQPGFFNALGSERPAGAQTEITANKEASFDSESNVAEFVGRVVVKDPQFTLNCDRLKVILSKDRKGIDTAEATGNVIIVQEKTDATSPKAIGRAGEVTYKPAAGEVVLRGWPSIQQGINNQVATEASTVMVLRSNGQSRTIGGSKTVIADTAKQP